jgi:hypothetical protein
LVVSRIILSFLSFSQTRINQYALIPSYPLLLYLTTMSETKDDSSGLEEAQKNQKKAGAAENDPETTGPAENLREEAAEAVDEDSDEKDSV